MPMTDDDAYELHREQMAERGPWPRRTNTSGWLSADDRRHRTEMALLPRLPGDRAHWAIGVMRSVMGGAEGYR